MTSVRRRRPAASAWLLPALPALAALALLLPGDWRGRAAGPVAVLATAASLALAVALLVATSREPGRVVETAHPIAPLVSAGTRVDSLAALLALVVTLVLAGDLLVLYVGQHRQLTPDLLNRTASESQSYAGHLRTTGSTSPAGSPHTERISDLVSPALTGSALPAAGAVAPPCRRV